ncbi:helix-turn-helix transcriptional regulator [Frankia sp. AgB32]|nr:helix-turn-helix transcriptional regulator [Frankia sp. AgB32]
MESAWDTHDGRRRRVYRLTAQGATALAEATTEWRRFSASMNAVLGVAG